MDLTQLNKVFDNYSRYKEPGFDFLHVSYADISSVIEKTAKCTSLSVKQAGTSIDGKPINIIKAGRGSRKILLWSQMHGDESTATKTIFDLLNFLKADDEFNDLRNAILNKLEINFIPMLNPDGAEKFTRENSIGIDLNRDASRLVSPEARILKAAKEEILPEFCFNLHDQNRYYSVGKTGNAPALSFLAPPFDFGESVNDCRRNAMQLIVQLYSVLQALIPGRVSKYPDDHEPRAFGDNFTMDNSAVVLIESGYIFNDPVKDKIRMLNFISLLVSFYSILLDDYKNYPIDSYFDIPESEERFFDLLLSKVSLIRGNKKFTADIGINIKEVPVNGTKDFYYKGTIEEIGDLSTLSGHSIVDCTGLTATGGKIFLPNKPYNDAPTMEETGNLLNTGFTTIFLNEAIEKGEFAKMPLNVLTGKYYAEHEIKPELPANIILTGKTGIKYLVVNGFLTPFPSDKILIRNGLIFR